MTLVRHWIVLKMKGACRFHFMTSCNADMTQKRSDQLSVLNFTCFSTGCQKQDCRLRGQPANAIFSYFPFPNTLFRYERSNFYLTVKVKPNKVKCLDHPEKRSPTNPYNSPKSKSCNTGGNQYPTQCYPASNLK